MTGAESKQERVDHHPHGDIAEWLRVATASSRSIKPAEGNGDRRLLLLDRAWATVPAAHRTDRREGRESGSVVSTARVRGSLPMTARGSLPMTARSSVGKLGWSNQGVNRDAGMLSWVAGPLGRTVESSRVTLFVARRGGGEILCPATAFAAVAGEGTPARSWSLVGLGGAGHGW